MVEEGQGREGSGQAVVVILHSGKGLNQDAVKFKMGHKNHASVFLE